MPAFTRSRRIPHSNSATRSPCCRGERHPGLRPGVRAVWYLTGYAYRLMSYKAYGIPRTALWENRRAYDEAAAQGRPTVRRLHPYEGTCWGRPIEWRGGARMKWYVLTL